MYFDRLEAGYTLARHLKKYEGLDGAILAIPRGGIPVAYAVARVLGWPVDIVPTKKIGHPLHQEYAIGAVSLTDSVVVQHEGIPAGYVESETARIRTSLEEMYMKFMHGRQPENLKRKTVIVIDDGIATGNTLLATISLLKKEKPARIMIAAPVASAAAVHKLAKKAHEIICPLIAEEFTSVGRFYETFDHVTDTEAMLLLDKLREERVTP